MDMPNAKENLEKFKEKVTNEVFEVKAITNEGLENVLIKLADLVETEPNTPLYEETEYLSHVLYKFKEEKPFEIKKEGEEYIIFGEKVEKMFRMTNFQSDEGIQRFITKLRKMGIDEELENMGICDGAIVKILDFEFEYRK